MAAVAQIIQETLADFEREAQPYRQHPLKLLHVDPRSIERLCSLHLETKVCRGSKFFDLGRVCDGDWDLQENNSLLRTSSTDRSVRERYVEGVPWSRTPAFRIKLRRIQEGRRIDGCSSRADLVKRYDRLDRVAEDMAKNGFRIMRRSTAAVDFSQMLSVSFTRNGEALLGTGGKHRLAIAKLLKLPPIPVLVFSRHALWQEALEGFFKGDHPRAESLSPHPDLQENLDRSAGLEWVAHQVVGAQWAPPDGLPRRPAASSQ